LVRKANSIFTGKRATTVQASLLTSIPAFLNSFEAYPAQCHARCWNVWRLQDTTWQQETAIREQRWTVLELTSTDEDTGMKKPRAEILLTNQDIATARTTFHFGQFKGRAAR
jgi:hypothetical protein